MTTTRFSMILSIAVLIFTLSGCSSWQTGPEPLAYPVMVNGQKVILKQITEGTWTALSSASATPFATTAMSTAALREAIETQSGCKVTDSDFTSQSRQFDAQVDCGSNLAN